VSTEDWRKEEREGEAERIRLMKKIVILAIIVVPVLLTLTQISFIVPTGYRGVVLTLGKVTGIQKDGFNFKVPFITSVELIDIRVLRADRNKESAGTKDLQEVMADVSVNYVLDENFIDVIYTSLGTRYVSSVIEPNIDEALKAVTAQFTAEELITKRESVKGVLLDTLQNRLQSYHLKILSVSFTDFQFSAQFNAAIEAKVTAEQRALEAKNKLEQVRFEEQQKILKAQAEANATMIQAQAAGTAKLIAANAEAESIRLINEQLSNSPDYLKYQTINQWDGKLPVFLGSGVQPLINIDKLLDSSK